jgi:glutamate racemase
LEREPTLDVVYLADSGEIPYGLQPEAQLRRTVERACLRLRREGATQVLMACHAASTVLPVGCVGVIDGSVVSAGSVLVLGGQRTIDSGLWAAALAGRRVQQRVAQSLSGHIEAGRAGSPEALADLDCILEGVSAPDQVVLACTHYFAMSEAIQQRLPGVTVVDPALLMVDALDLRPGCGRRRVLSSGPEDAFWRAAELAVGGSWLASLRG